MEPAPPFSSIHVVAILSLAGCLVLNRLWLLLESVRFQRKARVLAPEVWEELAKPPKSIFHMWIPAPRFARSREGRSLEDPVLRRMAQRLRILQYSAVAIIVAILFVFAHAYAPAT